MNKVCLATMNLISAEVCGKELDADLIKSLDDKELKALYALSKKHDMGHIVGDALIKSGLLKNEEVKAAFEKQVLTAVYRYEGINYELCELRRVLNNENIPYIPLKGSVIREYYPSPWQRTSCDIDILVHEEDLQRAVDAIVGILEYRVKGNKKYHDISLFSPSGIHLELHFNLKETVDKMDAVLSRAWEYSTLKADSEYRFRNEFLLFHLYAHASYHFIGGGCGIRPFVDFYLLRKKLSVDEAELDKLSEEAGIKFFSEKADELANIWFGDGEHEKITEEMESFVLSGGVYGNTENNAAVKQIKKGKIGYLWSRVWIPYKSLTILYPSLEGKRILQPLYEIRRWFRLFRKSTFKKSVNELKINVKMDEETLLKTQKLLEDLKL